MNKRGLTLISCTVFLLVSNGSCKKEEPAPSPSITNFSPSSAALGSTITINGSNFGSVPGDNVVKFNGVSAVVASASNIQLAAIVPASASSGKITVEVNGKVATSATDFNVIPTMINSISPTSGLVGSTVAITGVAFDPVISNNVVKFNGTLATVTNGSANSLTVLVPANATNGRVTVTAYGTTATAPVDFTVLYPAVVNSFSPTSGVVGSSVTITGAFFDPVPGNNIVKINGAPAVVTSATANALTVTVPTSATSGKIAVTANGNTATSATDFTVLQPSIGSFSPTSGVAGTPVTITGSFDPTLTNNVVQFNGAAATITSASQSQLVVTVPETASSGVITVSVNNSLVISANAFTILLPTITGISPNIGSPNIQVVITGTNFSPDAAYNKVHFNGIPATTISNVTSTSITASVPGSVTSGKVTVTVGPNTASSTEDFQVCKGSVELVVSNLTITSVSGTRTSFNYTFDLTNVGDVSADLTKMVDQSYVSTGSSLTTGTHQAAGGFTLGYSASTSTLGAGQTTHYQVGAIISGGGTVDMYPYLIMVISGALAECNTANNTAVKNIF